MKNIQKLKKLGLLSSFAIYIPAALLLYFLTKYLIPYLSRVTGYETILFWFIVAALGVFLPLVVAGYFILKSEGYSMNRTTIAERLRFKPLTLNDAKWIAGGLIAIGVLSVVILKGLEMLIGNFDHSPAFMSFEPLTTGRYWLLLVWLPYWLMNILGEEFLWRGVILPRQEVAFGKYAWLIHGFGWWLFHIAFGWQLMLTLMPIIFIQSYIVQRTKNSTNGVVIHAAINGPSFIAIALGAL